MSLETAFKEVKSVRFVARPNLNFLEQLSQYEVKLFGEDNRTPWIGYTANGVTRQVPKFIVDLCIGHYTFEFQPSQANHQ